MWVEEGAEHGKAALLTLKLSPVVKIELVCTFIWRGRVGREGAQPRPNHLGPGVSQGPSLEPPCTHPHFHTPGRPPQDVSSVQRGLACP